MTHIWQHPGVVIGATGGAVTVDSYAVILADVDDPEYVPVWPKIPRRLGDVTVVLVSNYQSLSGGAFKTNPSVTLGVVVAPTGTSGTIGVLAEIPSNLPDTSQMHRLSFDKLSFRVVDGRVKDAKLNPYANALFSTASSLRDAAGRMKTPGIGDLLILFSRAGATPEKLLQWDVKLRLYD